MSTVEELEAALAKAKAEAKKQERIDKFRANEKNEERMRFLIQRQMRDAAELDDMFHKGGFSDDEAQQFIGETNGFGDEYTSLINDDEVPQV